MNENDRHNEHIRRVGQVFVDGCNQTRCSKCGAIGAEYMGDLDDEGRDIALCPDGCGGSDDLDFLWEVAGG